MPRKHDRPDPNLIIEGSRRVQPSKRGMGRDYPITPLEALRERDKSKQSQITGGSGLILSIKVTQNDQAIPGQVIPGNGNNAFFDARW